MTIHHIGDSMTILKGERVKARKDRLCLACGDDILKGDEYKRAKIIYRGQRWDITACHSYCFVDIPRRLDELIAAVPR